MKAIEGIFMGYCTAFFCLYRKTMTTLLSGIRKREAKDSLAEQSTFSVVFFFCTDLFQRYIVNNFGFTLEKQQSDRMLPFAPKFSLYSCAIMNESLHVNARE